MSTTDWSRVLFIKERETPAYLPSRFRLPNNETRYSNSCLLDDIISAGYVGPISDPPIAGDNFVAEWDFNKNEWVLVENTSHEEYLKLKEHQDILSYIDDALSSCICFDKKDYTEKYKKEINEYIGELNYLKAHSCHSGKLLTWDSVPERPNDLCNTYDKLYKLHAQLVSSGNESAKYFYENGGVIPCLPSFDSTNFVVPEVNNWKLGIAPIKPEAMFPSYIVPSGYELVHDSLAASGYFYLRPIK